MLKPATFCAPQVRILLVTLPGLLGAIVKQALADAPDMTIVRELHHSDDLEDIARASAADVVVLATSEATVAQVCQRLLFEAPHVAIVAISLNGRRLEIYDRTLVREVSPAQLVEVIRGVARSRASPGAEG